MARINIEEDSWTRFYKMAEFSGCSLQECIGIVVSLWHESQTILEIGGTRENISEWSGLFKFSDEKCEKIIFAMKKSRFISQEKDDYFLINGNKTQIDGLMKRITRATKGGKSLKKKWKEVNELEADLKQASSNLEPSSKKLNSSHYKSIQVNSDQVNSTQISSNNSNTQKTKSFIASYCDRFKFRYGSAPVIQGKDAGIAKRIAQSIGEEKMELYLDAFFSMPDAWLVKTKHPLGAFETKMNEIVVFANTGNFTTQRQANQSDDLATNALLLEKVRRENL